MKKGLGVLIILLSLFIAGCAESVDEDILQSGKKFYVGYSKEDLEEKVDKNMAEITEVLDDSYFKNTFPHKEESGMMELITDYYYIRKGDYDGHPKYEIIREGFFEDKSYTVVSVNFEDYYYLISTSLIQDVEVNLEDEESLIAAKAYSSKMVTNMADAMESDYYFDVLREVKEEE